MSIIEDNRNRPRARPRPRFLAQERLLFEAAVNKAQRLAEPKERPPGKTEDEDDYDFETKGEERGAIKQTKLYSPHCGSLPVSTVRRSAFSCSLFACSPLTSHLSPFTARRHADTPFRRFVSSLGPPAHTSHPLSRLFACFAGPIP